MSDQGKVVRIGQLRKRITLQVNSDAVSGTSQMTKTLTTLATVYARVRALTGQAIQRYKNTGSEVTHEITIKYRSDVTTENRIAYDGYDYRIRSVQDTGDDRKRFLVLMCEISNRVDEYQNPNETYVDVTTNEFMS